MASIERTAYPRFKKILTGRELNEFFTPSEEEAMFARCTVRGDVNGFWGSMDRKTGLRDKLFRICWMAPDVRSEVEPKSHITCRICRVPVLKSNRTKAYADFPFR